MKNHMRIEEVSDLFGKRGRELLKQKLPLLPPHTRFATERLLEQQEAVSQQISLFEKRMRTVFAPCEELKLLQSLPGVGFILATVIILEVGDIHRFPSASHFASYAGTTPRVYSSGDKKYYGQLRSDINRYLKWAFVEAANAVCLARSRWPYRHVSRLYYRIRQRKGHQKAIGAVARHLAEATYWILQKNEPYREPSKNRVSSTEG